MTAMTTATRSHHSTSTATVGAAGAVTAVTASTLTALFAHTWGEVISMVALIVVVAALVYAYVLPRGLRRENAGGTALTLAIIGAVVVVPGFWTGLPLVLGVAAMILGNTGRTARQGSGKYIVALALGALTSLFYLSIYVMEGIAGNTGFLLG